MKSRREKTGLRGFRPGPKQIGLYLYRRRLEADLRPCFRIGKILFSRGAAQMKFCCEKPLSSDAQSATWSRYKTALFDFLESVLLDLGRRGVVLSAFR